MKHPVYHMRAVTIFCPIMSDLRPGTVLNRNSNGNTDPLLMSIADVIITGEVRES
jgi:hypothetical protein